MAQETAAGMSSPKRRAGRLRIPRGFRKLARYTLMRGVALMVTVIIGVYLSVLIANMGGYVDQIRIGEIKEQIGMEVRANPTFKFLPPSDIKKYMDDRVQLEIERLGLDKPFITRSFSYLIKAITLDLGRAERMSSDSGSKEVKRILLERLPATLVLFGTANLLVFFLGLFFALSLSRQYGSLLDRIVVALAPTSAAPPWFYGIFLILIFAAIAGILPYGGLLDAPPPETTLGYVLSVAKHMVLPLLAWLLSTIAITIYTWRTFFLIHSSEDYVELAKAKGLKSNVIERRYIFRPALPTVVTQFAMTLIFAWQGAIITETVFSWPGLGRLLFQAIGMFETPVIIGSVVIFAYLLAITVFLLDIVYALIDPRVKLGAEGRQ